MNICGYGCGEEAKHPPIKGRRKWCCEIHYTKCIGFQKKRKIKMLSLWKDSSSLYNSKNRSKKLSKAIKKSWNDPNSGLNSAESKQKIGKLSSINNRFTVEKLKTKYPFFSKIEKLKEINQRIYTRCKYNKCKKWFSPTQNQLYARIDALEKSDGHGGHYFYCSDKCKQECSLFNKSVIQLINEDKIKAGIIKEPQYTNEEYNTWREEILKRADYKCEYCGKKATNSHHIQPQKIEPFFSLDPDNGIACCEECHYKYGHKTGTECSTGNLANVICN